MFVKSTEWLTMFHLALAFSCIVSIACSARLHLPLPVELRHERDKPVDAVPLQSSEVQSSPQNEQAVDIWHPLRSLSQVLLASSTRLYPADPIVAFAPLARWRAGNSRQNHLPTIQQWPERTAPPDMGIPKFHRWMVQRFPPIAKRISEGYKDGTYFDNLYLDMNGIIHDCTHGDWINPMKKPSMDKMIDRMFEYTDTLFRIAKPRKLFYLAIDGVAPRAKMNQQRSRRYRAPRENAKIQEEMVAAGLANSSQKSDQFDSNCITPGTEFLEMIGERYKKWIAEKQATDPAYINGPTIVFSGADAIGEGEHKIMQAIRDGVRSGEFTADTRHLMYGLDADLIMLSLVTHQPKFTLLRERQAFQKGRLGPRGEEQEETKEDREFVYLEVELLREMLGRDLCPEQDPNINISYTEERLVDDFVFLCMFIGNDFLPGLTLDFNDGSFARMLTEYRRMLPDIGYLTDKEIINREALETFLRTVWKFEQDTFMKKRRATSNHGARYNETDYFQDPLLYKREYYLQKTGLHPLDKEGQRALVRSFMQGLTWCLEYYHNGCADWGWYYPDFYAPLGSDFTSLEDLNITLSMGKPFKPLAQLISVLPPESAEFLPPPYQELMLKPSSPIYDAYPKEFKTDPNGKRMAYEAVALLPFIDEKRLLAAVDAVEDRLTDKEKRRNILGKDVYYRPAGGYQMPELPRTERDLQFSA